MATDVKVPEKAWVFWQQRNHCHVSYTSISILAVKHKVKC